MTEIAGWLDLSQNTISTYWLCIFGKLGFNNNAELTRYPIAQQLVD